MTTCLVDAESWFGNPVFYGVIDVEIWYHEILRTKYLDLHRNPLPSPLISPTLLRTLPAIPSPATMSMLHTAPSQTPKTTTQPNCNFNSTCKMGEDCNSCPFDCNSRKSNFCCVGDHCDNVKCNINRWHCT